ncbi:MAG: protoporphyrinogen oxidase HemJ [Parvularculaceae bacterium]
MQDFLLANYAWLKALHIIAVIAWMAGLLYLPRLFVYHHQAQKGGEAEALFVGMERRLLKYITTPALIAVWAFAIAMIAANPGLFSNGWFHVKLTAVIGVSAIHGYFAVAQKKFARGERVRSERFWRAINEAPTLLMIVAVIFAVLKPAF